MGAGALPLAVTVCEYAELIVPFGNVAGVSVTTGQTCSVMEREPWQPLTSLVRTVMLVAGEAEAVGVPLMTPVLALSVRPVGSVPEVMVQAL